jgi:hypothetical protein
VKGREREPGEWRTLEAMWAVRDATAPFPGIPATLTSEQGRVLEALLLFVDAEGSAHPGMARIARLAGMHPQRVRGVLAGLERDAGPLKLTVTRERRNRRGEQDTHGYQLGFAADLASSLEKTAGDQLTDAHQQSREDCTTRLQKTAPPVSRRLHHPSPEDDKADLVADLSEDSGGSATAAAVEAAEGEQSHCAVRQFFGLDEPLDETTPRSTKRRDSDQEFAAAEEDFERRLALRKAKDRSWCDKLTPSMLVMLYLQMVEHAHGSDAADEAVNDVRRSWPHVMTAAAERLEEFQGKGFLAVDFFAWFAGKQAKASKKPAHRIPGWRLALTHAGLLDEYRNALRTGKRPMPRASAA